MIPVPSVAARLLIGLAVVGGIFAGGAWIGWDKRGDIAKLAMGTHLAADEKARLEAEKAALATEDAWRAAHYTLAYDAEVKRVQREQAHESTVSGLRDGTLRLRQRFNCPKVPGNPPIASEPATEEPGFRVEDALVAFGISDEADDIADERNQCIASYNALRNRP